MIFNGQNYEHLARNIMNRIHAHVIRTKYD